MLQYYAASLTQYQRLNTKEVNIGHLLLGKNHPIRVQTMTTTDTMDTDATVAQTIRCIEAGAEMVRITAPSKKEAENLLEIKKKVRAAGFSTPLIADIHYTPNAAEIAARLIEKVRINPGNYIEKKKFDFIEYTDAEYLAEIEKTRERFLPLVQICKHYGTAMRIGTNHGSLSDRIMSRFGDTPMGMVESALEFLRIARDENYHQIVLSMKSSNPQVMVQAYRLLVQKMDEEFGEIYPLHLGVTEAGDGEDGRIKSAIGIGSLLEDGIGDTIRVSLTEDPEFEIPVCKDIVKRYSGDTGSNVPAIEKLPYDPFNYSKRTSFPIKNIGGNQVPVVIADLFWLNPITPESLKCIGYEYVPKTDKWLISDQAADYVYIQNQKINFSLPGTLNLISYGDEKYQPKDSSNHFPLYDFSEYFDAENKNEHLNFVEVDCFSFPVKNRKELLLQLGADKTVVICLGSNKADKQSIRRMAIMLEELKIQNPLILRTNSGLNTKDEHLIEFATTTGPLLLDGFGDGIWLEFNEEVISENSPTGELNILPENDIYGLANRTAFSILQATRTRISKTEYISCPSCGRTLFDLQETTAKIRAATHHLKGVKIAIMGCIVNGPGEMADADFGYVGSGPGKITLYKSKEVMKKNIPSETAVEELIQLLKDNGAWVERA